MLRSTVSYRNVRYNSLGQALNAAFKDVDDDFRKLDKVYYEEVKGYIKRTVRNVTGKFKNYRAGASMYDRLQNRTGEASRELKARQSVKRTDANKFNVALEGSVKGPEYLNIQEDGGWITARGGGYITIPLPAALDSRGMPKKKSVREWKRTYVKTTKKGKKIIFQRRGGKSIPLYVLQKRVYIKPRLRLGEGFDKAAPYFERKLLAQIEKELSGRFV